MDLNAVRMFVSVVQAGSLSAAANRLGVPLPTLSRRIRALERDLKVQLLERTVHGTRLTDAGTRLHEHANQGIDALADAEQIIRRDQADLKGRLRLSLPTGFEPWWDLLREFQRHYPAVEISVYATDRRVDLAQDGIDVALRVGTIVHEAMVARRLLSYRHVLVGTPKLLKRLEEPQTPDDLHRFPCAVWCHDANSQAIWQLGDRAVRPRAAFATNDYLHLRSLVLKGEVVTELPPFLATDAVRNGRLRLLLPAYPLPLQEINLLYPLHRHPSSITRTYLDFCQKQFARFISLPDSRRS